MSGSKWRVLLVDDSEAIRELLARFIEGDLYEIVGHAANGNEAVEQFVAERPDVVIMDLSMPEMDGVDATRKIREIDPVAKVIICTGGHGTVQPDDFASFGATACIYKPFRLESVLSALGQVLG